MSSYAVDSSPEKDGQAVEMLFWFFYRWGFRARQDYFTNFESSQSLGGAKTGDPGEKTPDASRTACLTWLEPTVVRWRAI